MVQVAKDLAVKELKARSQEKLNLQREAVVEETRVLVGHLVHFGKVLDGDELRMRRYKGSPEVVAKGRVAEIMVGWSDLERLFKRLSANTKKLIAAYEQ